MNKYIRNIGYKVPFEFCKECKAFSPYEMRKTCLKDDGCKEAVRLYKKYTEWKTAATIIERLQAENDELRAENETYHKLVLLSAGEIGELRYKLHLDEMDIEEIKLP